ncbi:hypothetical protein SCA6_000783 [Theobroma cacao]
MPLSRKVALVSLQLGKIDNNRIARAFKAFIESNVDIEARLFKVKKIGNESKACIVLLIGASKDLLNEVERNLQVK